MTTLVTVEFFKSTYGNSAKSNNRDYPASTHGSVVSTKARLVASLKKRMTKFYPGRNFIFNFTEAK
jgi:hypothetical protein